MPPTTRLPVLPTLLAGLLAALPAVAAQARDGDLDPGFGNGGKVIHSFPGGLFTNAAGLVRVALLADGRILVAAPVINANGDSDFGVMRLNGNGSLDTAWANGGARIIGFDRADSSRNDTLIGMAVQPDGRILLFGQAAGAAADENDLAVVRLTAAGQPDTSFGTGGRVLVPFNLGAQGLRNDLATGIGLQPDGKILLTGLVEMADGRSTFAVARLNANGQRDTGFDGDGRVVIDFGPGFSARSAAITAMADGRLLVAGASVPPGAGNGGDFALARLNADGSPDTGFGTGGTVTFDFAVGGDSIDRAFNVLELPDGAVLACGFAQVNAPLNTDMACLRVLPDGSPDPAWPAVLVPFDRGGSFTDFAVAAARDAQGRFVLAGLAEAAAGNNDAAVARLLPDGDPDPAFGNGGTRTHNSCTPICVAPETENLASDLVIQPDGSLVLAGWVANSQGNYRVHVLRLRGDSVFGDGFGG